MTIMSSLNDQDYDKHTKSYISVLNSKGASSETLKNAMNVLVHFKETYKPIIQDIDMNTFSKRVIDEKLHNYLTIICDFTHMFKLSLM